MSCAEITRIRVPPPRNVKVTCSRPLPSYPLAPDHQARKSRLRCAKSITRSPMFSGYGQWVRFCWDAENPLDIKALHGELRFNV